MNRNHGTSALLLAALVASLVAAGPAAAGWAAPQIDQTVAPAGQGPIASFLHCLGVVNLTDQQKADAKAVLDAAKPVVEGLVKQVGDDGKALKALLEATPRVPIAIGTALIKLVDDEKAIKDEFVKVGASLEALLTPEQKAKFQGCLAGIKPVATGDTAPTQ